MKNNIPWKPRILFYIPLTLKQRTYKKTVKFWMRRPTNNGLTKLQKDYLIRINLKIRLLRGVQPKNGILVS